MPLLTFVPQYVLPSLSLFDLADRSAAGTLNVALDDQKRDVGACTTPLCNISCANARTLIAHRLGLKWLAAPIAFFVTRYPSAQCGLFEGDMSLDAILAWRELFRFAPRETKQMLRSDFSPILSESLMRDPRSVVRRAHIELATARASWAYGIY